MMKILITGSNGFIGKNLKLSLINKYEIFSPSHKEVVWSDWESVKNYFNAFPVEVIIHCANKPGHRDAKDKNNIAYENLRMFTNLYEAFRKYSVKRFIMLGSGSVYDMYNYRPRMREEELGLYVPSDETGFSKYMCSKIILNEPCMVDLRFFGVFGPYENYAIRFISNAICKSIKGLPITIKQNRIFDYVYIDDAVKVIQSFIEKDALYRAYNITSHETVSLLWLAELVRDISGKDIPILVKEKGLGLEYSGDNTRLTEFIPQFQFTPLEDSIKKLYNWYYENQKEIDISRLLVDK